MYRDIYSTKNQLAAGVRADEGPTGTPSPRALEEGTPTYICIPSRRCSAPKLCHNADLPNFAASYKI